MNELKEIYGLELSEKVKIKIAMRILYDNAVEKGKSLEMTSDRNQRVYLLSDLEAIEYAMEILEENNKCIDEILGERK